MADGEGAAIEVNEGKSGKRDPLWESARGNEEARERESWKRKTLEESI